MKYLNNILNIAIFFGILLIGIFIFQMNSKTESAVVVKPNFQNPQDLANVYLQEADKKLKTEKIQAEIALRKINEDENKTKLTPQQEIDPSTIKVEQQIWKDNQAELEKSKTAEDQFREQIEEYQNTKMKTELAKKEYIRQYKENARKNGYEITINDNLEVINVVPIRKPTNDVDPNALAPTEY